MKLNLKLHCTNFLVRYLAGFGETILKVSKCFAFRLQVYETWFGRVIASYGANSDSIPFLFSLKFYAL